MGAGEFRHLLLGGGGRGAHQLQAGDLEEMVAVVLVKCELGSVGRFAGREGAGDFHGKNGGGAARRSLSRDFLRSKSFAPPARRKWNKFPDACKQLADLEGNNQDHHEACVVARQPPSSAPKL
jgi:hypothetical protein